MCAVGGALLAQQADAETLRKLFGGFLILVGLSEVFLKGLKRSRLSPPCRRPARKAGNTAGGSGSRL
ncbi:MAG: hypothetical protein ACLUFI_00695 [Oscillospiraceae bacterium]